MKFKFLSLVLVMAFVLAACSTAQTATALPPASEPEDVPATAPADIPAESVAPFPMGRFNGNGEAVQYNPDGTFEFYSVGSDPVFVGQYTVQGRLITTVNPNDTDPNCMGEATYEWSFEDNKLTFKPTAEDQCRGRREANADTYVYDPAFLPEIKVNASDFKYVAPLKVRSGWFRIILNNTGTEVHHVQFLRLNDGVTLDQFQTELAKAEGPALALTQQVGGVGAIAPGMTAQSVINLTAGEYVILCLIPSPSDQVAHHSKGMIRSLTVQDASGHGVEPTSALAVHLKDFMFDLPESLPAGKTVIQVTNEGPEPHEFNILRLEDGKTVDDVKQFLSGAGGPPPFAPVGGMNGLDVGLSGYAELDLTPGMYVAICNIPSPKGNGAPHFMLGMIQQFAVAQ